MGNCMNIVCITKMYGKDFICIYIYVLYFECILKQFLALKKKKSKIEYSFTRLHSIFIGLRSNKCIQNIGIV